MILSFFCFVVNYIGISKPGESPVTIRDETDLSSGAEVRSVTKRPNKAVILSQSSDWRENPPDIQSAHIRLSA